ncbi:diguanylate cyclase [Longimicrobium sp.]|uniref:diguanylate cyclase n=1 Tax=Longimicrobium sp. TaxID=2029185 RepID=UPI002E2F01EB|nr:diguanylate cyclase [Longimicrobium sp.]HEX6039010.1 diguanylate cyclase [Longimicrobium sp.]
MDAPRHDAGSTTADDASPRARVDALNAHAWDTRAQDAARAAVLADEALRLAEAEGYKAGMALALRTRGFHRYLARGDYEGALHDLRRALSLLDEAADARGRADVLNGIGNVHWRRGEYADAMRCHLRALEMQRGLGDRMGEGHSLNALGNVAYHLGDYGQALDYYQDSLKLREEIGDRVGVAYCLNNIGNIHGQLGELQRALDYMLQALEMKEGADPQAAGISMLNVGSAYADLGDDERALEYMERAAVRLRETGSLDGEATCLRDIGRVHERRGELDAALACYRQSLEKTRSLGARMFEAETLIRLGSLRVRMGEGDAGLADLHAALETVSELGARPQVYAAHEALTEVYEQRGALEPALRHHRAFHAAWREVFNAETNARIKSVLVRAEVQQAQREAEILRGKNDELTAAYGRLRQADEEKARLVDRLRDQAAELERQTREDALTRVSNRRHLDAQLATEWERALRFGRALTVAMVDIDHFKQVNDRFSHAVGDEVLRTVARILRDNTRGVDVVARYGGEEFCLILVETRSSEAAKLCDRLRGLIADYDWSSIRPGIAVTVSIGVAGLHEGADAPDALLAAADVRLYAAKHAGRNRVLA